MHVRRILADIQHPKEIDNLIYLKGTIFLHQSDNQLDDMPRTICIKGRRLSGSLEPQRNRLGKKRSQNIFFYVLGGVAAHSNFQVVNQKN